MAYCWLVLFLALSVLQPSLGVNIVSKNFIRLPGTAPNTCAERTLCRYAACFSNSVLIDPRRCFFVGSSCTCPDFKMCMPTKVILPRPGYYKHEYACQNPVDFLFQLPISGPPANQTKDDRAANRFN